MNAHATAPERPAIPGVNHILAVASGKGGVGKSTTAANLAVAMAARGASVGLMDADIYGPDVPVMMGVKERPGMSEDGRLLPLQNHGVKLMSLGLLADSGVPVIWRGPMLSKIVTQFLNDVEWAPLDCLVVDMPPGTGDVQLTLTQAAPIDGAVIVTTPQPVALEDVRRGVQMFREVNVPVLGIIENMSQYVCPKCGTRTDIFGHGGGAKTAEFYEVPFLGHIPLDTEVRRAGDAGAPITVLAPESEAARVYSGIAERLLATLESGSR